MVWIDFPFFITYYFPSVYELFVLILMRKIKSEIPLTLIDCDDDVAATVVVVVVRILLTTAVAKEQNGLGMASYCLGKQAKIELILLFCLLHPLCLCLCQPASQQIKFIFITQNYCLKIGRKQALINQKG